MNIFCYFTISHVASVRVIRRNYAYGERNKIRVKKNRVKRYSSYPE